MDRSRRWAAGLAGAGIAAVACLGGCGHSQGGQVAAGAGSRTSTAPSPGPERTARSGSSDDSVPVPSTTARTGSLPRGARPVRIRIPSIAVNSALVDLGVEADGTLQVPSDYQTPGWLDRGPAPGQQGPAVIAGHVDSKSGPAVFYRLRDLKSGAKIIITTGNGKTVTFTVDGVAQYAKTKFPTAAVYGPVPGPVLRLITCGGAFDRTVGHYRDNLVVYAS